MPFTAPSDENYYPNNKKLTKSMHKNEYERKKKNKAGGILLAIIIITIIAVAGLKFYSAVYLKQAGSQKPDISKNSSEIKEIELLKPSK